MYSLQAALPFVSKAFLRLNGAADISLLCCSGRFYLKLKAISYACTLIGDSSNKSLAPSFGTAEFSDESCTKVLFCCWTELSEWSCPVVLVCLRLHFESFLNGIVSLLKLCLARFLIFLRDALVPAVVVSGATSLNKVKGACIVSQRGNSFSQMKVMTCLLCIRFSMTCLLS